MVEQIHVMILFGGGGHCKSVLEILKLNGETVDRIYDGNPQNADIFGVPVFTDNGHPEGGTAIISIGDNASRRVIDLRYPLHYTTAVHPDASLSSFAELGAGSVVLAGARISPAVRIGRHCIINSGAVIEHDCTVGDFVHVSPNATLSGAVTVGEGTKIGIGACVLPGITLGKWVKVAAGTVVKQDVPDYAVLEEKNTEKK